MQDNNQKFINAYYLAKDCVKKENVIGIQKEKILHKTIKYYLCSDDNTHEVKINKLSNGVLYADVLENNVIYEVQTSNFNKLRKKLDCFLTNYIVTIVYPIAHKKIIYKIDDNGVISKPHKSPKIGSIFDLFKELYKIKSYLKNPNLNLKILLVDLDEYRQVMVKKHFKSKGYKRQIQIPQNLYLEINLNNNSDYQNIIHNLNLTRQFTSEDLAIKAKITKAKAMLTLNILLYLEVVKRVGKDGNSYVYELVYN